MTNPHLMEIRDPRLRPPARSASLEKPTVRSIQPVPQIIKDLLRHLKMHLLAAMAAHSRPLRSPRFARHSRLSVVVAPSRPLRSRHIARHRRRPGVRVLHLPKRVVEERRRTDRLRLVLARSASQGKSRQLIRKKWMQCGFTNFFPYVVAENFSFSDYFVADFAWFKS